MHTQSCTSMIDRILRAIECTRNRGSRDLLIGHFSLSPSLSPSPQSRPSHYTCTSNSSLITHHHSRPPPATVNHHKPLPLTPTAPHFKFSHLFTITSPPSQPQPFTFFFFFLFFIFYFFFSFLFCIAKGLAICKFRGMIST